MLPQPSRSPSPSSRPHAPVGTPPAPLVLACRPAAAAPLQAAVATSWQGGWRRCGHFAPYQQSPASCLPPHQITSSWCTCSPAAQHGAVGTIRRPAGTHNNLQMPHHTHAPVQISHRSTPMLYKSTFSEHRAPVMTSGAIPAGRSAKGGGWEQGGGALRCLSWTSMPSMAAAAAAADTAAQNRPAPLTCKGADYGRV